MPPPFFPTYAQNSLQFYMQFSEYMNIDYKAFKFS